MVVWPILGAIYFCCIISRLKCYPLIPWQKDCLVWILIASLTSIPGCAWLKRYYASKYRPENLIYSNCQHFLTPQFHVLQDNGSRKEIGVCCIIRDMLLLSVTLLCRNTVSYYGCSPVSSLMITSLAHLLAKTKGCISIYISIYSMNSSTSAEEVSLQRARYKHPFFQICCAGDSAKLTCQYRLSSILEYAFFGCLYVNSWNHFWGMENVYESALFHLWFETVTYVCSPTINHIR